MSIKFDPLTVSSIEKSNPTSYKIETNIEKTNTACENAKSNLSKQELLPIEFENNKGIQSFLKKNEKGFPNSSEPKTNKALGNARYNLPKKELLPIEFENDRGISRWFRKSDGETPGIVIDPGQKKHVSGNLFGTYQGKRQSMFSKEDSTPEALIEILTLVLKQDSCKDLQERPTEEKLSGKVSYTSKSITVELPKFRYKEITIQDPTYTKESDAWNLHCYPEN